MNVLLKNALGMKQLFRQLLTGDTSEMSFLEKMVSGIEDAVQSALGVNLTDMIIQILATIVLVIIVKKFFWGKITDFLHQRQAFMETELSEAEKARVAALALKEQHDQELKEVREKSKDYFEAAKKRGDDEKKRIIEEAKAEAKSIVTNGQKEVEYERQKAKEALKKEVVSIASLMTEKMIGQKVDESEFIDSTIDDIEGSEEL